MTLHFYQEAVESLLKEHSWPGASVEELELFKSQFRTSAYTCRLRFCPRATIGFESESLRKEHEIAHAGGFQCTVPGCQYPRFSSSKSLAAHVNQRHRNLTPLPRKSIRRVGVLDLDKSSTVNGSQGRESSGFGERGLNSEEQINLKGVKRLHSTYKSAGLRSTCSECLERRLRCSGARPSCASCKRWSRVCAYPTSCQQCILENKECDQGRPACEGCKQSTSLCSY